MEKWKAVKGFEGAYEVSDQGRVRRIKAAHGATVGHICKPRFNKDGNAKVLLNGRFKLIHVLVAQAFIPNPLRLPEVNHIKGKSNAVSNLEWRSKAGNVLHAMQNGLYGDGVHWDRWTNKWSAKIRSNGKRTWLGRYRTKKEALEVYRAALAALPYIL